MFVFDVVGLAMMESIQEICCITFIFSTYQLVFKNESSWKKYFTFLLVFFTLFCTWVPFYTFVPLFFDVNKAKIVLISYYLYDFVYLPSFFLFHAYFTGMFALSIQRILRSDILDGRLLLMARKCVIHSTLRYDLSLLRLILT